VRHGNSGSLLSLGARFCQGVADPIRFGGLGRQQLARIYIMSLLHTHMSRRDVKVTHSPLQRRALIKRTAAACSKTCIDGTNARRGDPNRCLRALCQERVIVQRSGKCVVFRLGKTVAIVGERPNTWRTQGEVLPAIRYSRTPITSTAAANIELSINCGVLLTDMLEIAGVLRRNVLRMRLAMANWRAGD
jgi:hypothetical protein